MSLDSPWPCPPATLSRRIAETILPGVRHPHARRRRQPGSTGQPAPRHADQHPLHRPNPRAYVGERRHGTLDWTHGAGSGKAWPSWISGEVPAMNWLLGV